ncbi:hypothetical protein P4S63_19315 [Pseudoalteromonas sp. B193]
MTLVSKHIRSDAGKALSWMVLSSYPKNLAIAYRDSGNMDSTIEKILTYISIGEQYKNLVETTQKAVLAQLRQNKKHAHALGCFRVPGKKGISLQLDGILNKLITSSDLTDTRKKISTIDNKKIR